MSPAPQSTSNDSGTADTPYECVLVETRGRVGMITLHRPKALNALNSALMEEVVTAAAAFDADPEIGAIVVTGSPKAFAAGADIKEMAPLGFSEAFTRDLFGGWDRFARTRTPVIAAVAGYALGGGCELAMMCDTIVAADTARFGQPEIDLGLIPGMGGSQHLTRAVGKATAMDMVLTGRQIDAEAALRLGLVARVVPADDLLQEAMSMAQTIASRSLVAAMAAKEAVNAAFETPLEQGLRLERRLAHGLFATEDQKEGMGAFVDKRTPEFRHR